MMPIMPVGLLTLTFVGTVHHVQFVGSGPLLSAAIASDRGQDPLEAANAKLQAGHYQEAIDFANKALVESAHGLEPLLIKALAYLQMGQYETAVKESSQYLSAGGKTQRRIR